MNALSPSENARARWSRFFWIVLILAGLTAIWWLADDDPAATPAASASRETAAPLSNDSAAPWKGRETTKTASSGAKDDPEETGSPVLDAWMAANWNRSDAEVIEGLLEFARRSDLGLAEKIRAIENALNLLPDTDYAKLDPLLLDPSTSPEVLGLIFTDMHNRSEKAILHASLQLIQREEPEVAAGGKALLAHWLDMDEANETEAIRLQAETRLLELSEDSGPDPDMQILPPDASPPVVAPPALEPGEVPENPVPPPPAK